MGLENTNWSIDLDTEVREDRLPSFYEGME